MIFIDYKVFRPSRSWQRKVKLHLRQIAKIAATGDNELRNKTIDKKQPYWTEIKSKMIKATVNKCWFSEGTSDVAHFHIEHFRPKKKVTVLPKKFGWVEARTADDPNSYWWLVLNYKNFRIAGHQINSNKGNFFPLRPGSPICNTRNLNIGTEQVMLLDPTVETDADLLTFDVNGTPIPAVDKVQNPYEYLRAELSIRLYGLNDSLISDARKRCLQDFKILRDKINRYYSLLQQQPENVALQEIVATECAALLAKAKKHQPFSKMIRANIKYLTYQWAIDHVHPYL